MHYYGLSEKVKFRFFSSVSITNRTHLTSISFSDNWKQGWLQPVVWWSLVVNCKLVRSILKNAKHTAFIYSKMLKALAHLIRSSKGNQGNRSWGGEGSGGKSWKKKPLTQKKIFLYSCSSVYKILLKMRGQWIQIAENKILVKCGLPYFLMSLSFVFGVKRFINCVASA